MEFNGTLNGVNRADIGSLRMRNNTEEWLVGR